MPRHTLNSILVATDLTERSDVAIEMAASLGRAARAPVHVFHCIRRPGAFGWWDPEREPELRDEALHALRSQLDRAGEGSWRPNSEQVAFGAPARAISEHAATVLADAIVLGPHAPRAAADSLLGTTADRVIRTARVPCFLAHEAPDVPFRTVLLATDFSPPAGQALEVAADWLRGPMDRARPVRALIVCVSAYAEAGRPPVDIHAMLSRESEYFRERIGDLDHVAVEEVIHSAPMVAEGVQAVADDHDADLVVAGTHGYHMISRLLLGSTASAIASTVRRPLLLVPPPGGEPG